MQINDPARYTVCATARLAAELGAAPPGTRHQTARRVAYRVGWLCGRYQLDPAPHLARLESALATLYTAEGRAAVELEVQRATLESGVYVGATHGATQRAEAPHDAAQLEPLQVIEDAAPAEVAQPEPPPAQPAEASPPQPSPARRRLTPEARRARRIAAQLDAPAHPVELHAPDVLGWLARVHADPTLRPSERVACVVLAEALDARGVHTGTIRALHDAAPHLCVYDTLRRALAALAVRGVHLVRVRALTSTGGPTYHHALVCAGEAPGEALARLYGGMSGMWSWSDAASAWVRIDTTARRHDPAPLAAPPEQHRSRPSRPLHLPTPPATTPRAEVLDDTPQLIEDTPRRRRWFRPEAAHDQHVRAQVPQPGEGEAAALHLPDNGSLTSRAAGRVQHHPGPRRARRDVDVQ